MLRPGSRAHLAVLGVLSMVSSIAGVGAAGCGGGGESAPCVSSRDCELGMRCVDGECSTATIDAGTPEACGTGDCDDGIACTRDRCLDGVCESVPDDTKCTEAADGRCVLGVGCEYGGCSTATCVAGPCQSARCEAGTCILEAMCASDQECCGDACVARGCDDGDPCTDDACGAAGCEHTPNTAPCDDGVYCNGGDTCSGGACSVHAGNPCSGAAACDEGARTCGGCASDADCPAPLLGAWSACDYASTCAESGARSRTVTTYSCVSGTCAATPSAETEPCTRTTTGTTCGSSSYGAWSACAGFVGDCDETGTRSRTRTDLTCVAGACGMATAMESEVCGRSTDGAYCEDFLRCTIGTCAGGSCGSGGGCPTGRRCCEPGICVCSSCLCP